jgi:uncharacterized protein (TIGR03435 family)
MTGTQTTMSNLVFVLARQLKQPVTDGTGLVDQYNFQLKWTPDLAPCVDTADNSAPSMFSAVQEQLGLQLESIRGPVDTLVVDRAVKPSNN